ncbi:MAG: type IV pilus biogenesis/stability protein PilW [Gammaproteobacteria bacterium]|nr:type IV pilus biogenesis/stability protein PilW [Gammaproteobacteria bacterium]MDH5593830.1 type IV pilus biogenesis/stability protein PilW [Gammaproteobacteria bacterium]MDH5613686.1 type IV pilus biogenesis/stability protein PilW [Gammaproteobacteria bacterium]
MRRITILVLSVFAMVLGGCAQQQTYQSEDQGGSPKSAAQINAQLGLGYLSQKKYKIAMLKLKKALHLDPDLPEAHHYIGELYNQLEQYDDAERHYKRAVDLNPSSSILQNNYGAFLYQQGKLQEALSHFENALKDPLYKSPDQLYENIGRCYYRIPDIENAEINFRKALELNPRLPASLYYMASINYDAKNFMGARAFLQRYRSVARHTARTLWLGIKTERVLGDKDAVSSYALLLKSQFPDSEEAKLLMDKEK